MGGDGERNGLGLLLGGQGVDPPRAGQAAPGGLAAHQPLPQPLRADAEGPAHQEPEASQEAAGKGGAACGGGAVQLLPADVRGAQRVPHVRGGVQAQRRRVDHEAHRQGAGAGHLPVQQAQPDQRLAARPHVEAGAGAAGGRRGAGDVSGAAVPGGALPGGRQEVRPAHLRPGHLLQPAAHLPAQVGLRALHQHALQHAQGGHHQHLHAPHQCGHPEARARLRQPEGHEVVHPQPAHLHHHQARRGRRRGAVPRHPEHHHPRAAGGAARHDQRQALLRAVRLRRHDRRQPQALAHRGERLALAHGQRPGGLGAQDRDAGGPAGHRGPGVQARVGQGGAAHGRLRPHLGRRPRDALRQAHLAAQHAGLLQRARQEPAPHLQENRAAGRRQGLPVGQARQRLDGHSRGMAGRGWQWGRRRRWARQGGWTGACVWGLGTRACADSEDFARVQAQVPVVFVGVCNNGRVYHRLHI